MSLPRVLVIAEAANPEWVSVPLVGWSLAHALREVAEVHLVTHIRNRDAVLRAGYAEGTEVTFIDSERLSRPLWQLGEMLRLGQGRGWTTLQALNALAYPLFERLVWKQFGAAIEARHFDIVHRVTPLSPTIASPVAAKCAAVGVPFVLGPLNGGVPWPEGFNAERLREREMLSYLRSAYRLLPGHRRTLRHAAAILAGSRHTASEIPQAYCDRLFYLPENAVDPARFAQGGRPGRGPLRACFIGRMVPYKGPDMLLSAAAPLLQSGAMRLEMIGDGPMLKELKAQTAEEGLEDAVTFHGWLPHPRVAEVAGGCHLLSFPSIREFGGGVVLEAMALGLVPMVVDYAGPGELVTPETGIKVPIGPRAAVIKGFREALRRAAADPAALAAMAEAGRAHVNARYTWSAKARQMARLYDWVRDPRQARPDLLAA